MAVLPCPCKLKISGKVKVVKRGLATGLGAELAAIDEALNKAEDDARKAMNSRRCAKPCTLAWKPPTFKVRASGSSNNFEIVGVAIVVWTIFPVCVKPPKAGGAKPSLPIGAKPPAPTGATTPVVPATGKAAYPFTKQTACGTITISIAPGLPGVEEGSIVFDFQPKRSENCHCEQFGWIQHIQMGSGRWHYDNGTDYSMHGPIGAPSDPTQNPQPTQPASAGYTGNPWYGASSAPNPPPDFAQHPTPQTRIGDKPTQPNTSYVTQLVCVVTGEVVFSWYWGPVPNSTTPLKNVPAGPTPPP